MSRSFIAIFFFLGVINQVSGQSVNAIGLRQGAKIISSPLSYVDSGERNTLAKYSPGALFDDTYNVWCSKNAQFPLVFVCELTEEFVINELRFNNKCENYAGIEAKDVKVEFSTTSSTKGFELIDQFTLKKGTTNDFQVKDVRARWVRLTLFSNYGHEKWVELAEFEVIGKQSQTLQQDIDISGPWKTNWQNISFKQNEKKFSGSYAYDNVNGTVSNGIISRNMVYFKWKEGSLEGTATLYMNAEGDRLSGLWINKNKSTDFGLWTMTRNDPVQIKYDNIQNSGNIESLDFNGKEVKIGEKVILNNVLFVKSKAVLLPESLPELNDLILILKKNSGVSIFLTGHTDNTGDDQKNVILSEKRVDSVKRYLIDHGIDQGRIDGKGFGPFQPLNGNKSAKEKQLNRRVEFTLK